MRETSPAEIDMMAQSLYENPLVNERPASFLDLPAPTRLHLRRTAYVFLTGDFGFVGRHAPTTPEKG